MNHYSNIKYSIFLNNIKLIQGSNKNLIVVGIIAKTILI